MDSTLCDGEPLWDVALAWNTTKPIVSRCLQRTIPIWLPSLFLFTFAPFQILLMLNRSAARKSLNPIPVNPYNLCRLLVVFVIIAVNAVQLTVDVADYITPTVLHPVTRADLLGFTINVLTFMFFAYLIHLHRLYGVHTSAITWLFTALSLTLSLPSLYMYSRFYGVEDVYPDRFHTGVSSWNRLDLFFFIVHFTSLLVLFILTCFADSPPPPSSTSQKEVLSIKAANFSPVEQPLLNSNHEQHQQTSSPSSHLEECPDQRASFFSTMTYLWIDRLILKGYRRALTTDDLWRLNAKDSSDYIAPKFTAAAATQQQKKKASKEGNCQASSSRYCTVSTIARSYGWLFLGGSAFKLAFDLLQFAGPQLLAAFIDFILAPASAEPSWHGYLLGASFFLVASLQAVLLNYHYQIMYQVGMRVRAGLIAAVYEKALVLSNGSRRAASLGSMTNLMAVDTQRLVDTFPNLNNVWSAPLQILLTLAFLWAELGPSVLAGLAVLLAMMPLNAWISALQRRYALLAMKKKDRRLRLLGELLSGVKAVKLYGWEEPWQRAIGEVRAAEIGQLRRSAYVKAATSFLWTCAPFAVTFVTFAVFVLVDPVNNVLDAKKAFVSLALFELLRIPLSGLPDVISNVVNAMVAVARMDRFLNNEELQRYVNREMEDEKYVIKIGGGGGKGASFSWQKNAKPVLSDINLKVRRGALVAIVGHVGAGKSSLLSAILGDMEPVGASCTVNIAAGESVAYVGQCAWIANGSLRSNILLGSSSSSEPLRYRSALEQCALLPDLATLPAGELTEIGEKGINLSGGQRARVALARAVHSAASLLLLDDPLSAVDSHVARHIFRRVLSSRTGVLRGRTRLLVTHSLALLPEVDQIVVMEGGRVAEAGTYQQLMADGQGRFAAFVREHSIAATSTLNCPAPEQQLLSSPPPPPSPSPLKKVIPRDEVSRSSLSSSSSSSSSSGGNHRLITPEKAKSGRVSVSVYATYLRSLTAPWLLMTALGYVGMQAASVGTNVWLAVWANDGSAAAVMLNQTSSLSDVSAANSTAEDSTDLRNYRLTVYGLLGLSQGLIFLFGAVAFALGTLNSSVTMHRRLLARIMHSPMRFFDTTPSGRVANVFSKDIDALDVAIPLNLNAFAIYLLQVLATIVLICVNVPLFLVVIGPIVLLYYFIQKFYVPTSRQLKRLESITRSPIFSHFSETLSGVSTIRAFGATSAFIGESHRRVDANLRCFYPKFIANRWLAFRLKLVGNLIVLFSAIFAVHSRDAFRDAPGFVGLIMTYSLSLTQILNWLVRQSSDLEANAVSVERIEEYCSEGSEAMVEAVWRRPVNANPAISEHWPTKGAIEFEDVSVRYRPGLELVLKGVSLVIDAGQKVGVCGRTGSGKSTLTLALFRILEADQGRITIDGVDISRIGLHELRHCLAIIPQDSVLFSGTIRSNLDPFGEYADAELWRALELCHLKQYVTEDQSTDHQHHHQQQQKIAGNGLDYPVSENGANLSVGMRQLLCLGRALLKNSKILVLDEATAAIDLETDALIQATIRREFAHCTVITIAHRLITILDADKILVLEQGRVAEFDTPGALLARPTSQFYSLARDAGIV